MSRPCVIARHFYWLLLLSITTLQATASQNPVAPSIVPDNQSCVQCHQKNRPQLIKGWHTSAHATAEPVVDCISCHGNLHQQAASRARQDTACISCHGGEYDPVVHSYSTSKHGVLMRLEKSHYDWNQPLARANYRAPGCSYCHMYQSNHNVNAGVRSKLMDKAVAKKIQDQNRNVCQNCHAPRYITRLFENGERMLEIGRKKFREASTLIEQAAAEFSDDELAPARQQLIKMQQHLKNVYLGVAHQSPDYQWWHGHPALDGDLLRIKGLLGVLRRKINVVIEQEHKE